MGRRFRAGSKSSKRKPLRRRRNAPKPARGHRSSASGQETEVARFRRERDEALLRESANSDILRLISKTPGDLEVVFRAILENATRICEAKFGVLHLYESGGFRIGATHNAPFAFAQAMAKREPIFRPSPQHPLARVAATKRVVQVSDLALDEAYKQRDPGAVRLVELASARSLIAVPMLRDKVLIGDIVIYRQEVRPFTDKQIELLTNFADQAMIAIENTRLLNELRERTTDLTESLERQTATSEVLRVISSSPGELEPVFKTMLANAVQLCDAKLGSLFLLSGDTFRVVATHGAAAAFVTGSHVLSEHPRNPLTRLANTKQVLHIPDVATEQAYVERNPRMIALVESAGGRTALFVPMLKEGDLVGAIAIYRQEVQPFADKQIELVQNFAAQAVIAIENTRLLNELHQRTSDLTESLEQQTATSQVLRVISSSPSELEPVFKSMLVNAMRICEAEFGHLLLYDGECFRAAYLHNLPPAYRKFWEQGPVRVSTKLALGRLPQTKEVIQITDMKADRAYGEGDPLRVATVDLGGAQTLLCVPMLKENHLIGAIVIYRQEVRPFTDKQVELVKNFAAQAVIAIENARLLNELRGRTHELTEALEQRTATSEVLGIISSSPGELLSVFDTILANALRLCDADTGHVLRAETGALSVAAMRGGRPEYAQFWRARGTWRPEPHSAPAQAMEQKKSVQIADMTQTSSYAAGGQATTAAVELGGLRTVLMVPMIADEKAVGIIVIYRSVVRPFSDKQIALVESFAAQAVIAIENARLLNELRESLERQTATSEVLKVISSSPGELEPVFQALLENATRICEAKFGTLFQYDGKLLHRVASIGTPAALVEFQEKRGPLKPETSLRLNRLLQTKAVCHTADELSEPEPGPPAKYGGARSILGVPMVKDEEFVGAIVIYRQEVRPFTDKQIALVQNFAAQAVIAIENTRLLNELRQRTTDLAESLEQQTATSEVLSVISSSPGDLKPVFETILTNATRLCEAKFGLLYLYEDGKLRFGAAHDVPPAFVEARLKGPFTPSPDGTTGRVVTTKQAVQIADLAATKSYSDRNPVVVAAVEGGGVRTALSVPMLKENALIGVISIYRKEVRPFTDKQTTLLQNFAAQAVIAIENTRLLNELRDSLQQQTATADVLKIISRSTFDLKIVLNTLVESAVRVCEAELGNIARPRDEGTFFVEATHGMSAGSVAEIERLPPPHRIGKGTAIGRALLERKTIHILDAQADPDYELIDVRKQEGLRTLLGVPLMRDGVPIGVFALGRRSVRPFTEKQIELVTTFADQAVIAIENVRLFDEIQDKSRQLEEASQHKSQFLANMSHELRTPLNAILGYTELMADGAYGEPSEKMLGILKRLEANGKHLLGLINDVLDLSKIEAGQLVLELSDYSFQDIAQTVRSTLEPLAADKKLRFKVEVAPQLPSGHGDGRRLTQVLINLVGNAIKFTDAGEVAIKAEAHNGSFYVSVRDTGPGISAVDQAKLFQEFQQADNAITRKKGGTGLGLAISKRIIEMHGGRIWVESQPGQGSTFAFALPVRVEKQVGVS